VHLEPFFMAETSGSLSSIVAGADTTEPLALVLIGHTGDHRQWLCTPETQEACELAFVVDRIAWARGQDVPVVVPESVDQQSGAILAPRLHLEQVSASVGKQVTIVAAAPFLARDIATIDPRWTLAGDDLLWLVRSVGHGPPDAGGATRAETVWLLDDTSGAVIDSHLLAADGAYQPARVWPMATVHGAECCGGEVFPYARVEAAGGPVVYERLISGYAEGGDGYTTFGGGYGASPLVLPAGAYTIHVWLGSHAAGVTGTRRQECSAPLTLGELDNVALIADFPVDQACSIQLGPVPGQ
jgi:hypothetical protein